MEYTEEQKIKILSKNGFTSMVGYCFSSPTDQDYQNHFVSKDEVEKVLKEGCKTYFWHEGYDYIMTLDEAWDNFIDSYLDDRYEQFGENEEQMLERLRDYLE